MCIYLAFMELSIDTLTNLQSCPHLLWWLLLQSPRNVGPRVWDSATKNSW